MEPNNQFDPETDLEQSYNPEELSYKQKGLSDHASDAWDWISSLSLLSPENRVYKLEEEKDRYKEETGYTVANDPDGVIRGILNEQAFSVSLDPSGRGSMIGSLKREDWGQYVKRPLKSKKITASPPKPPRKVELFDELADLQKGNPELQMMRIQEITGGGPLSGVVEHGGDLVNRMARKGHDGGYEYAKDKIFKVHNSVTQGYGFEKEVLETAKWKAKQLNIPFEDYLKVLKGELKQFAKEHKRLPAYNESHKLVRDFNVAIGEWRFDDAKELITKLKAQTDKGSESFKKWSLAGIDSTVSKESDFQQIKPQIPMYRPTSITDPALDIRDKPMDVAIDMARTERHIIPDTSKGADGHFVGSPKGMNTQMELKQMREHFDYLVEEGIKGSDWYNRAREGAMVLRPGSKADRAEHSGQLAVLSAQADPSPNLGWTIESTNEFAAGNNVFMVRTPDQSKKIIEAHTGVKSPGEYYEEALGLKTGVFEQSLNPDKAFPTAGTNDIWHGRAFSFTMDDGSEFDRGFSPQEHRFLDYETVLAVDRANQKNLGGRSNWTAAELQAAAWINVKGRGLFKKNPEKYGNDLQEAMKEAAKTYPDYYPKFTVQATHEAIPSPAAMKTGHLSKLQDATYAEKEAFTDAASWVDPTTNKDIMFDEMGMLQTDPMRAKGLWEGEISPVEVSKILVSLEDAQRGKKVGKTSEGLLSTGASVKGFMDAQAGAAWSKAFELGTTGTKKASSGSYTIGLDRPLTELEMQQLSTVAGKRGLDVIDTGEGVTLANFNYTRGQKLVESLDSGSSPIGKNIKEVEVEVDGEKQLQKIFTEEKAGALKEIKFKFAQKPSKEELKYLKDLRDGKIDDNKYKVQIKGKLKKDVTITQVKSQGDEMERVLDDQWWSRGLGSDIEKIFPEYKGSLARVEGDLTGFDFSKVDSGEATRKLQEVMGGNPAVLARLDNSKKIREQAGRIAKRNMDFAAENNDTVREDIQLALRLIENGGFTALFDALKRGALLPAIVGPMLLYGILKESDQPEGHLSPET